MLNKIKSGNKGSVLVMAVVLSFATIMMGVTFLTFAITLRNRVTDEIGKTQAFFDAVSGSNHGRLSKIAGFPMPNGRVEFFDNNYYDVDIYPAGSSNIEYGTLTSDLIVSTGTSEYMGNTYTQTVSADFSYETYADYLYISHRERDSLRHVIIRFWTPDTLDGKVHSNDTIHIVTTSDRPRFMKRTTTTAGYVDPPNNHARFDEGGQAYWRSPIIFPDQAVEIRNNHGFNDGWWGTQGNDSLTQIVLSNNIIRKRKCGLFEINGVDSIRCYPASIAGAPTYPIPPTGVIFIHGKVWISATRGRTDIMDGEFPERSWVDGGFISEGFSGQLTIGSSDTMIITDNLVYKHAKANNSVPSTMDSCSDVLGLVSERYIMMGRHCRDTIYVNAALAAVSGSISVQDIYMNHYPDWDNEKQSLFIYGSLAQRNRGIVHTTDYPPGHLRGFIEKDYHYDIRLKTNPPPHFLPTLQTKTLYTFDLYGGGGN